MIAFIFQLHKRIRCDSLDFRDDDIRFLLLDDLAQGSSVKHRDDMEGIGYLHGRCAFIFVHCNHLYTITLQFNSDFLSQLSRAA